MSLPLGSSFLFHKGSRLSDFIFTFHFLRIGERNGNPLQCSCLENPRDGGAWRAPVYGVTQSRTRLKRLSSSSACFQLSGFIRLFPACVILGIQNLLLFCLLSVLFSKLAVFLFIWQSQEPVHFLCMSWGFILLDQRFLHISFLCDPISVSGFCFSGCRSPEAHAYSLLRSLCLTEYYGFLILPRYH